MNKILMTLSALFLSLSMMGGAQAQDQVDFSDADLQSFAAVQESLQEIRVEYSQRLESAADADQAAELQQEASTLMVEAVEEQGLDVDTYNMISVALQSDESLRERIEAMLN